MNPDIYVVDSSEGLNNLFELLYSKEPGYLCLDLETDSVQEKIAKIHGIGLCINSKEAFYVPVRNNKKEVLWSDAELDFIYSNIADIGKERGLLGWNLIYDTLVYENNSGIVISDSIYCDGILLKHTVAEERPFGLKEVSVKYLGPGADKAQTALYENIKKNGGATTKDNTEMWKADDNVLAEYCGWDVILTYKLYELFIPQLKEQGLEKLFFDEEVMPLYREVTIPMKRGGFPVDVPYFRQLHTDIKQEILNLEKQILKDVDTYTNGFIETFLNDNYPAKASGNFPKMLAKINDYPLPLNKDGNVTLARKEIEKLGDGRPFYMWLLGYENAAPDKETIRKVQYALFYEKNPDSISPFNLGSNDHLGWLFFERLGLKPLSKTEGGKPQCDDDFLESVKDKFAFVKKLVDYKKLQKLCSTYIEGILERQIDGVLYSSMLQFGTTSGRYSSTAPNLQNLPRPKGEDSDLSPLVLAYTNSIRKGLIAPKGFVLCDQDYSALEPRCFADMSDDKNLQNIFFSGEDMYSSIAKRVFHYGNEVSSFKKDKNFLGTIYPEKRQIIKTMALAVTYGAESGRIADLLSISRGEAEDIINDYLEAFPGLKKYIETCHKEVNTQGFVRTRFGRIRHLDIAKGIYQRHSDKIKDYRYANKMDLKDIRRIYKNQLNNSTNFKIQGLAAHIINRAMIAISREFKKQGVEGYIAVMIHDQIVAIVRKDQGELAKTIMKEMAENTTKISVPLIADPKLAYNLKESH